jgi:hypothetical protein
MNCLKVNWDMLNVLNHDRRLMGGSFWNINEYNGLLKIFEG